MTASGWRPTKFVYRRGHLVASRDPRHVAVSSRLAADLIAHEYEHAIPTHAKGRLLDLGCGTQPLYATYIKNADHVVAADWPSSVHTSATVDVFCDLGQPLPFRTEAFDTIVFSDVLEHLADPSLAFSEIARILAPGGRLIMNTPFMYWLHEEPHDFLRHTRYSLERHAATAGLGVVELRTVGGVLDVVADIVAKVVPAVPVIGPMLSRAVQAFASAIGTRGPGAQLRRRSSAKFPLSHFMVASKG